MLSRLLPLFPTSGWLLNTSTSSGTLAVISLCVTPTATALLTVASMVHPLSRTSPSSVADNMSLGFRVVITLCVTSAASPCLPLRQVCCR